MGPVTLLIHFNKKSKKYIRFTVALTVFLLLTVWLVFVFIIDPEYRASSQVLIEEKGLALQNASLQGNHLDSQSIEAFAAFIVSPTILEQVRVETKMNISISDLRKQIIVDYSKDSPVLTITAISDSSQQSVKIVNAVSSIYRDEVNRSLPTADIRIISLSAGTEKASADKADLLIGIVAAAVFGFVFNILTAYIKNSIKEAAETRKDARKKENQLQTVFK